MRNKNANSIPRQNRVFGLICLFFRWLAGGVLGSIIGAIFLAFAAQGMLSMFSLVLTNQYITILYAIGSFPTVKTPSLFIYISSFLVYSAIWGLIGALLASGRKRQILAGSLIFILYVIVGCIGASWIQGALMD